MRHMDFVPEFKNSFPFTDEMFFTEVLGRQLEYKILHKILLFLKMDFMSKIRRQIILYDFKIFT